MYYYKNLVCLYFIKEKGNHLKIKKRIIVKETKNHYYYFIKFKELKKVWKKHAALTVKDAFKIYLEKTYKKKRMMEIELNKIGRFIDKAENIFNKLNNIKDLKLENDNDKELKLQIINLL